MKGSDPIKDAWIARGAPALFFEDPLCPTCKAFHDRLTAEDVIESSTQSSCSSRSTAECNWMLDRALHPGACLGCSKSR